MLGIGKCGNRRGRRPWGADEITNSLEGVVLGPDAEDIRGRPRELAEIVNRECGREVAATLILEELELACPAENRRKASSGVGAHAAPRVDI